MEADQDETRGLQRIMAQPTTFVLQEDDLRATLDDALDDLPRFMAVTQPADGWVPGEGPGPTMFACVTVDAVREMIRTAGAGRQEETT